MYWNASQDVNSSLPKHGSVVTISQVYGNTFYHFLAEGLSRAMPLLEMILDDKNIRVHTYRKGAKFVTEAMMLIGVPKERLIQGNGCANVLYIPEPVGCGGPSFEMLHMIRRRLRHELKCPSPLLDFPMQIVFIKREGSSACWQPLCYQNKARRIPETTQFGNITVQGC
jgi:hypothetical protein